MSKQSYSKQFSLAQVQFSSIWRIDRTLSGATTPGQSRTESDGNEKVLRILQSTSITGTSPLFSVISRTLVVEGYPSAVVQSVYSTALVDWATSK